MTSGVYKRTPEMKTGKYKRTSEHCAITSAAKMGHSVSGETRAAISASQRGIPKSPEHCAAMSEASRNSDAVKANANKQRGGNDICNHHYIYDHADLSKNTVQMTRSNHQKLHKLLRKLGYIVPHINGVDKCTT